jgi:hypothetical protein
MGSANVVGNIHSNDVVTMSEASKSLGLAMNSQDANDGTKRTTGSCVRW